MSSLKKIFSTFRFRRAYDDERKQRLWSTPWYGLVLDEAHLETEEAAIKRAEEVWEEEEFAVPVIVRKADEPDPLGTLREGWHVYYLDLLDTKDLDRVARGYIPAFVRELDDTPFSTQADAVWACRKSWRQAGGRTGMIIMAEVLERSEVTRRRLQRAERR